MGGKHDYIFCFPPETSFRQLGPGKFEIRSKNVKLKIGSAGSAARSMLKKLALSGDTHENLKRLFKSGGTKGLLEFHFYIDYLNHRQILCRRISRNGQAMMTLVPTSPGYRFEPGSVTTGRKYVLSRFAYIRRSGAYLILESPLSCAQLILHNDRALRLIHELAHPKRCRGRNDLLLYELLRSAGALSEADARNRIREDLDPRMSHWEFHDLLFHSRTRIGRHNNPYGKIGRQPLRPQPRNVKPPAGDAIALYRPDMKRLTSGDVPFTQVIETRRSQRRHGKNPITLQQIAELLYRSARSRNSPAAQTGRRVYPGTGAVYELELYLLIHNCDGLSQGIYHYDPLSHQLFPISGRTVKTDRLLRSAAATAHSDLPQVLLLISSRFQAINRHYQSISYASILKDVGALYQTLYLVATAMGLAGCALGAGDSDLFCEVTKRNYYEETSVGEFMLGSASEDR